MPFFLNIKPRMCFFPKNKKNLQTSKNCYFVWKLTIHASAVWFLSMTFMDHNVHIHTNQVNWLAYKASTRNQAHIPANINLLIIHWNNCSTKKNHLIGWMMNFKIGTLARIHDHVLKYDTIIIKFCHCHINLFDRRVNYKDNRLNRKD